MKSSTQIWPNLIKVNSSCIDTCRYCEVIRAKPQWFADWDGGWPACDSLHVVSPVITFRCIRSWQLNGCQMKSLIWVWREEILFPPLHVRVCAGWCETFVFELVQHTVLAKKHCIMIQLTVWMCSQYLFYKACIQHCAKNNLVYCPEEWHGWLCTNTCAFVCRKKPPTLWFQPSPHLT